MIPIRLSFSEDTPKHIADTLRNGIPQTYSISLEIHCEPTRITLRSSENKLDDLTLSLMDKPHRFLQQTVSTRQCLWRALQLKSQTRPYVVDCTAGFGEDSFILSILGARVVSLEQNGLVAALLNTLVTMLKHQQPSLQWQVHHSQSEQWLRHSTDDYTHVYVDPFFHKKSNAKPKNPIQWLQNLCHEQQPCPEKLLQSAQQLPVQSIIVKRAKSAGFLGGIKPDRGSILQKASRFDCYSPVCTRSNETS